MSEEVPMTSQAPLNEGDDSTSCEASNSSIDLDSQQSKSVEPEDPNVPISKNDLNDPLPSETSENEESSGNNSTQESNNEARLQQLEKEHETLKSQYMRIAADFDNFRKRQTRDQDDLRLQLTCNTLSSILPIVDNFERARQQLDPQGEEAQALHRSYQGLYKQLVEVLKQLGVAPMRVADQLFDPSLHEAVLREPSNEKPEDVIIEELQRGYHLNGRVLRHALVKVSMGPGPEVNKSDSEVSEQESVKNSVAQDSESESSESENDS